MPGVARHQSAPGAMCPGMLYHVTWHAVAGTWLFETARDQVMFRSFLAEQCRRFGDRRARFVREGMWACASGCVRTCIF